MSKALQEEEHCVRNAYNTNACSELDIFSRLQLLISARLTQAINQLVK